MPSTKAGQFAEQFHPDKAAADDYECEKLRFALRVGFHVGAFESLNDVVAKQQRVGDRLEREGVLRTQGSLHDWFSIPRR